VSKLLQPDRPAACKSISYCWVHVLQVEREGSPAFVRWRCEGQGAELAALSVRPSAALVAPSVDEHMHVGYENRCNFQDFHC
jgi:hypothetical protein